MCEVHKNRSAKRCTKHIKQISILNGVQRHDMMLWVLFLSYVRSGTLAGRVPQICLAHELTATYIISPWSSSQQKIRNEPDETRRNKHLLTFFLCSTFVTQIAPPRLPSPNHARNCWRKTESNWTTRRRTAGGSLVSRSPVWRYSSRPSVRLRLRR
jgi:hypothetical protein